jgi:molybdopterin adenylyltransferase
LVLKYQTKKRFNPSFFVYKIGCLIINTQPHPDSQIHSIACAVITISDTRTIATDTGGQAAQQLIMADGHQVSFYQIIPDEPDQLLSTITALADQEQIQAIICSGGTGIAPRDRTYEALAGLLEKTLPGFGELFRWLSYAEIGTRTISSRAIGGTYRNLLIFSLPGSQGAVELGLSKIILPELNHLVKQLRQT